MAIDPISALGAGVAAAVSMQQQQRTAPRDIEAAAVRRQNRNDPANSVSRSGNSSANTNIVDSLAQTRDRIAQTRSRAANGQAPVTEADINRAGVDANGEEFRAVKLINASVPQPQETEAATEATIQAEETNGELSPVEQEQPQQAEQPDIQPEQADQAEQASAGEAQAQTLAERIAAGRQEIDANSTAMTEQPAEAPTAQATGNLEQAQNNGETLTATEQETITDRLAESATVQTSADIAERNTALTPAQEQGIKTYEHVQNYSTDPLSLSNAASAA